jgi:flavodoxin
MDTTLIVFYSYTGNSRQVARLLAAQKGWPVGEVIEDKPRSGGGIGYFECLVDSMLGRSPAVHYQGPAPADFAQVVLIAPIWLQRLASPMRTFVRAHRGAFKHLAVITTMGSRGGSNAVAEIGRIVGKDPVLAETITEREVQDGSCAARLEAFGAALVPPRSQEPVRPVELSPEAG